MHLVRNVREAGNVRTSGRMRDTTVGTWIQLWRLWGRGRATDLLCDFMQTDSQYVGRFQGSDMSDA